MAKKPNPHEFEIGFFESVLRRNPRDTGVIEILGGLYTKDGRINDGLKMDRRLVRLLPDNATAHFRIRICFAAGRGAESPGQAFGQFAKELLIQLGLHRLVGERLYIDGAQVGGKATAAREAVAAAAENREQQRAKDLVTTCPLEKKQLH